MHQVQDYLCGALSATELAAGLSSESDDQVENETLVELIARGNIAFFVGSRFFLDLGIQISADQIARDLSEDEPAPSSLSRASHLWQMSKGRRALRESLKQALSARDIQSPKLNQVAENLRNGRPLLAVTTFYDDVLEKTLAKALVRIQVVSRAPVEDAAESGRQRNELVSGLQVLTMDQSGGHTRSTIDNLSNARPLESGYSLVYRLCGGVSFEQETSLDADTLVVAEPDFFEFARSADHVLPDYIVRHLKNKNVFFLGCDLSSWNECLVLYSLIKHLRGCKERLYAVQHKPTNYDREFWRVSGISLVEEGLEAFFQRIGTAQL